MSDATAPRRPFDPSIYLVADIQTLGDRDLGAVVDGACAGGATAVQVRGKRVTAARLLDLVRIAADASAGRASVIVNDRVDVFLAARARGLDVAGVHIGQQDIPAELVRHLVGGDAIVGLSASTPAHMTCVRALAAGTVDYLGVGAVRATPTKPERAAIGWDGLRRAIGEAGGIPCVAIGGIGPGDAAPARAAGAAGQAIVRAICLAEDPRGAARELADEWRAAGPAEARA
ncbi:thiamine phosphate synthase [Microbacterium karelineae]|uniref:thiamine phosphate synthase n=1 Tax=Microbacterium karelineae TaxID=2654283 RepID=UPI0012EAD314|nr:thiamine phosphate synthase [Microbacterium karelineae]